MRCNPFLITHQIKVPLPIIHIKWTRFKRLTKQIPFVYLLVIALSLLGLIYLLLKMNIEATWKSVVISNAIYIILFSKIEYKPEHRLLLKQYAKAFYTSVLIDALLISIPFYFVNILSGVTTSLLALVMALLFVKNDGKPKIIPIIPSPLFVKSSFMWHSKVRYLLPIVWVTSMLFIIIARVYDNYNLAMVSLGVGGFISFASSIMQEEDVSFVQIYISKNSFIRTNLKETIYNSMIFSMPLVAVMIVLFPTKWPISLAIFLALTIIAIMLSIIKYAFYPSLTLATVVFVIGLFITSALAVSIYGIALIPIYFAVIYYQFSKNLSKLFKENEEASY